jgi:hypothetical protein
VCLGSSFLASELPSDGLAGSDSGFRSSAARTVLPVASVDFDSVESSGFFDKSTGLCGVTAPCFSA